MELKYELTQNGNVMAKGTEGMMNLLFEHIKNCCADCGFRIVKLGEHRFGTVDGRNNPIEYEVKKVKEEK